MYHYVVKTPHVIIWGRRGADFLSLHYGLGLGENMRRKSRVLLWVENNWPKIEWRAPMHNPVGELKTLFD
jgi:hypothetical protein